jgi:Holliday junction resolvase
MGGRQSRRKGHDEERLVARELRELGFEATTSRNSDRRRDAQGIDITAHAPLPLAVQVKKNARPRVLKALEEAIAGAVTGELPAALITFAGRMGPNGCPRILVLDWTHPETRALLRRGCGIPPLLAQQADPRERPDAERLLVQELSELGFDVITVGHTGEPVTLRFPKLPRSE